MLTETFTVREPTGEQTEYTIKTRLGWMEQDRIDERAFRVFLDGKAFTQSKGDLDDVEEVEIRMTLSDYNLARLCARLDMKPKEAMALPSHHARVLLERIDALEDEAKAELEALKPGNPTETP